GPETGLAPASSRYRFPGFFIWGTAAFGFTLIPELFAFGECKFHFHTTILEVQAGRNQREALLLSLSDQLADFVLVDKQLTGPERGVVEDVAVIVGTDVSIQKPELAVLDQTVGILEVGLASPDGFHLRPSQNDAGLKFFEQEVVMRRDPINGGVSLPGGSRIPTRIFLWIRLGLMGLRARHSVKKRYHMGGRPWIPLQPVIGSWV